MKRRRTSTTTVLAVAAVFALACFVCLAPPAAPRVAEAKDSKPKPGLKKSEAQKVIADLSLLALSKGAVVVKDISPGTTSATVTAEVRMGFRFTRDERGAWRAREVRVGDREWEDFDLLARAAGADQIARARAALDALAAELDALARAKKQRDAEKKKKGAGRDEATKEGKKRGKDKRKQGGEQAGGGQASDNRARDDQAVEVASVAGGEASAPNVGAPARIDVASVDEKELARGALRVKNPASALSGMGSSAVVEASVEGVFDLVRDDGAWRVASVRIGDASLTDFDAIVRALDAEKARRARADLDAFAAALEAFRRERGFYVVADSEVVLMDFLHPRYIPRVVRLDPWHRPYEYAGTRDSYTLRSDGADGKPNTADDIEKRGGR
ncbi:MAG: type II secretion system protein GspG [Acidobacteria bacterium]|nr:type II secretion system protein GspG [Acidobacteriota bacterium]